MRLTRRQLVAYAALVALVAAVGVRYLATDGGGAPAGEELVLAPAASSAAAGVTPSPSRVAEVLVHVCGAVRAPGVVRLPEGARVAEALELAGGASARADLAGVNLAARVVDGQQIVVPQRGGPGTSAATAPADAGSGAAGGALVNINTATAAELETLPGVGPATAQKIVDYRTAHGGFKTLDDLKSVPGIGEAKFAAVKDAITI